jgi:hypothetical protein
VLAGLPDRSFSGIVRLSKPLLKNSSKRHFWHFRAAYRRRGHHSLEMGQTGDRSGQQTHSGWLRLPGSF